MNTPKKAASTEERSNGVEHGNNAWAYEIHALAHEGQAKRLAATKKTVVRRVGDRD